MKSDRVILLNIIILLVVLIISSCAAVSRHKYKRRKAKPCDCPQFSKAYVNKDYSAKSPDTLTITPNFVASCIPLKY